MALLNMEINFFSEVKLSRVCINWIMMCTYVEYSRFDSTALLQMQVTEYFEELASCRTKVELSHEFEIFANIQ